MGSHYNITVAVVSFILVSMFFSSVNSDTTKDREECTEQLVGLATCLPYVGGDAKAPTPDCCNGLKQVLKTNKTCLCVIVRDRNDPALALKINATLALGLPSVCHASANVSQCPALLHLAPNSTEAQVFYQFGHGSNDSASSPISSEKANATTIANRAGTKAPEKSDGCCNYMGRRWFGLEVIVGGVLLWCFTSHLFT